MQGKDLIDAVEQEMPFGKYKGRKLIDIPEEYLVWMNGKGFPKSKIGQQLALIYEVKLNGLEDMAIAACKARPNDSGSHT
ncbi:MAG: DUF3820 family protein [Spirochaetota bacterium]